MTGHQPVAKFRCGQVTVALWLNEIEIRGRIVPMLKATVERRYRAQNGEWKSTGSFAKSELPYAIWCLQRAFDEIVRRENENDRELVKEEKVE